MADEYGVDVLTLARRVLQGNEHVIIGVGIPVHGLLAAAVAGLLVHRIEPHPNALLLAEADRLHVAAIDEQPLAGVLELPRAEDVRRLVGTDKPATVPERHVIHGEP